MTIRRYSHTRGCISHVRQTSREREKIPRRHQPKDSYINGLQSALARKDSLNLALVTNLKTASAT